MVPGEAGALTSAGAFTLIAVVCSGYVICVVWAFYMNRKNLYVAAKGFNIIFVDHMVTVFNIVCLCGRQVAVDLGGHFPCSVTNLSNLTTSLIVVMLMCMRTFRIYVLFDPKLRERLGPYVKPSAYRRYMVGLWGATLVVWSLINDWGATRHFKFCISRCNQRNCLSLSSWPIYAALLPLTQGTSIYVMKLLHGSRDAIGVVDEAAMVRVIAPITYVRFAMIISYDAASGPSVWGLPRGVFERVYTVYCILFHLSFVVLMNKNAPRHGCDVVSTVKRVWSQRDKLKVYSSESLAGTLRSKAGTLARAASKKRIDVMSKTRTVLRGRCRLTTVPAFDDQLTGIIREVSRGFLCEEAILFLLDVQELERSEMDGSVAPAELAAEASRLIEKYVRPGCDYEVNVSSHMCAECLKAAAGAPALYSQAAANDSGEPATSQIFGPSFREMEKVLAQNIMPTVKARPDYEHAWSSYLILQEQGEDKPAV